LPTALIIGARNFGFAIAQRLLADGWSVAGGARSEDTLEKLRAAGADALEVDVIDQASVLRALRAVADRRLGVASSRRPPPTPSSSGRRCRPGARSPF
jgi:NAD(P)-dependent dehydrogenase (short-subunit alcohol dehydrogenase family)